MFLFIFFYVKLSFWHLCVCENEYNCYLDPWKDLHEIFLNGIHQSDQTDIYLTQFNGSEVNQLLNEHFIEKCSDYYEIHSVDVDDTNISNFKEILTSAASHEPLISLYIPDYYKLLDNNQMLFNDFYIYAGSVSIECSQNETKCNDTNDNETKCNDTKCIVTNCNTSKRSIDCGSIKIISKSVQNINDGDLYDFVEKIEYVNGTIRSRDECLSVIKHIKYLETVLLCLDDMAALNDIRLEFAGPLKLHITTTEQCEHDLERNIHNFLAVLAPKPLKIDCEYTLPVILYDTPYMFPEFKTNFPNSMTIMPWPLLKYGFLKFIKNVGWRRLAIVSDDSPYSIAFEKELTVLFNKERITYKVIRCEDTTCNMGKALSSLNSVGAQIVIANVEEQNARFLIRSSTRTRIWLVRDMARSTAQEENVFSFTLESTISDNDCDLNKNILNGIRSISLAYKNLIDEDFTLTRKEFYRKFTKLMRLTRRPEAIAVTYWKTDEIASVHVNISGAKEISFRNPYSKSSKPTDGPDCWTRSYNYSKPCQDIIIVFFMLICILFFTTLLVITCYFHRSSPFHDIRYQNLY